MLISEFFQKKCTFIKKLNFGENFVKQFNSGLIGILSNINIRSTLLLVMLKLNNILSFSYKP